MLYVGFVDEMNWPMPEMKLFFFEPTGSNNLQTSTGMDVKIIRKISLVLTDGSLNMCTDFPCLLIMTQND